MTDTHGLKPIAQVLEAYFDKLDYLQQHRGKVAGVPTGFIDLDQFLGGFQSGDLIILAARPGVGKTSLSLGLMHSAAVDGKTVAMFSLEMPAEQSVLRLLSMQTGIAAHRLRLGHINDEEWEMLLQAMNSLSQLQIYFADTPDTDILEARTKILRLQKQTARQVDLIQVDCLQIMRGSRRGDNRVQEISEIARGLKGLARELNIPVISTAQLSYAVDSRSSHIPMLSDLQESGSIADEADMVMFIYREELYDPETKKKGLAELHIAKHRNGPLGVVNLRFFEKTTRFADLELYRAIDSGEGLAAGE